MITKTVIGLSTKSIKTPSHINYLRWKQVHALFSTNTYTNTDSSNPSPNKHYDVLIVGGGVVGSTFAHLLSQRIPSLNIGLVDSQTPKPYSTFNASHNNDGMTHRGEKSAANPSPSPSPRAYAISPRNLKLFGENVVEKLVNTRRLARYDSMQVWESDGPATLHFTHEDIASSHSINNDDKSFAKIENVLGAVIEDSPLVSCLWDELRKRSNVDLISPVIVQHVSGSNSYNLHHNGDSRPKITYQRLDGHTAENEPTTATTNLLVAADGANSYIRRSLGVFPTLAYGYDRKAITCTVQVNSSMMRTAYQRFQKYGPIALLPVWDNNSTDETIYANIVWSTTPDHCLHLQQMNDQDFVNEMNSLLQAGPTTNPSMFYDQSTMQSTPWPIDRALHGMEMLAQSINTGLTMSGWTERQRGFSVPPLIQNVIGKKFTFDLNLMHAKRYTATRIALIGDAAHTIHPMAGQGLNLGIADANCLVDKIQNIVIESGMGMAGCTGLDLALQQYEIERQREVVATMAGIQALHEVFGTSFIPSVYVRSLGMNLVNSIGPLRRKLAMIASGYDNVFNS